MSIRHQCNNHNDYTNYGKRTSNNKHYKSHTNQHSINNNNNVDKQKDNDVKLNGLNIQPLQNLDQ